MDTVTKMTDTSGIYSEATLIAGKVSDTLIAEVMKSLTCRVHRNVAPNSKSGKCHEHYQPVV